MFGDSITLSPVDELQLAWQRVPNNEYCHFGSLKGRSFCALNICYHTSAIVLKPAAYLFMGGLILLGHALYRLVLLIEKIDSIRRSLPLIGAFPSFTDLFGPFEDPSSMVSIKDGFYLLTNSVVAPVGQIMQLFKAVMGLLHPGFYYKADPLTKYFDVLASIAEETKCNSYLIDLFKNGPAIIRHTQRVQTASRLYYDALFERDLAIITEKLTDPAMSNDDKLVILGMFVPMPSDSEHTGIYACPPGLSRILEQICACLDVPKDPVKIIPSLAALFQEEILHTIVMQIKETKEINADMQAHLGNAMVATLGPRIGLPQAMIENASHDPVLEKIHFKESEIETYLEKFNASFTEEDLLSFLMGRINSQPDGTPGLKNFRDHMIIKLAENIPEDKIIASQKEVQEKFGVGEALSDDPHFYVKLHYFLYPTANPSEECATDLNEMGIKAFAATLEKNPFDSFMTS